MNRFPGVQNGSPRRKGFSARRDRLQFSGSRRSAGTPSSAGILPPDREPVGSARRRRLPRSISRRRCRGRSAAPAAGACPAGLSERGSDPDRAGRPKSSFRRLEQSAQFNAESVLTGLTSAYIPDRPLRKPCRQGLSRAIAALAASLSAACSPDSYFRGKAQSNQDAAQYSSLVTSRSIRGSLFEKGKRICDLRRSRTARSRRPEVFLAN